MGASGGGRELSGELTPPSLDALLPADFLVEWGDPREVVSAPLAEELALVASAVPKRRNEFLQGRQCARAALRRLGLPTGPILVGSKREPLWPEGVVGSITHCDDRCAAVVTRSRAYAGVGIDLEPAKELERAVAGRVATLAEMQALPALSPLLAARLVFSAKESFYKCQFALTRAWLDFRDVAIELDPDGAFGVRLLVGAGELAPGTRFTGAWHMSDDHLFTAIALESKR
ncbi:MAG TPA: 4'-phosphopantetheinyl transferase superfamily protein [Polyangiaceae bacterium]|nr:4'-phosphopantetheinyl transferase superfamily protein [Polyangiaceae bacterium]